MAKPKALLGDRVFGLRIAGLADREALRKLEKHSKRLQQAEKRRAARRSRG